MNLDILVDMNCRDTVLSLGHGSQNYCLIGNMNLFVTPFLLWFTDLPTVNVPKVEIRRNVVKFYDMREILIAISWSTGSSRRNLFLRDEKYATFN